MAKNARKRQNRLADMDASEPLETYRPPPAQACDPEEVLHLDIGKKHRIISRVLRYRGKIVDYSIQLTMARQDEERVITRIDTAHGVVHQHYYGDDTMEVGKKVIATIPLDDSWSFVDDSYEAIFAEAYRREV